MIDTEETKETHAMTLRMPKELHDWLKQHATKERRTLTHQILHILEEYRRQQGEK